MKLFTLAIASVVDANTGYGLVHDTHKHGYQQAINHGRSIRARSVLTLLNRVRQSLIGFIAYLRASAQKRREIARLARLDDHLLRDIGLTRADVIAVRYGQVSLEQLNLRHRELARQKAVSPGSLNKIAKFGKLGAVSATADAVNESTRITAKCA